MSLSEAKLPEEIELDRLEADLSNLASEISEAELELETEKVALLFFRQKYYSKVGVLFAQRDQLTADLSAIRAGLQPNNEELARVSAEAEVTAKRSSEEAGAIAAEPKVKSEQTPDLKMAYRSAAKAMHPDRASDDVDRSRRTEFMIRANLAYEASDLVALEKLLVEFKSDPNAIKGEITEQKIVKAIRSIAQLRRRGVHIAEELEQLRGSDIAMLRHEVVSAEEIGLDPLADLEVKLRAEISELRIQIEAYAI